MEYSNWKKNIIIHIDFLLGFNIHTKIWVMPTNVVIWLVMIIKFEDLIEIY